MSSVGSGLYMTRLTCPTRAQTKGSWGGFVAGGLDSTNNLFAEVKYHVISRYDRQERRRSPRRWGRVLARASRGTPYKRQVAAATTGVVDQQGCRGRRGDRPRASASGRPSGRRRASVARPVAATATRRQNLGQKQRRPGLGFSSRALQGGLAPGRSRRARRRPAPARPPRPARCARADGSPGPPPTKRSRRPRVAQSASTCLFSPPRRPGGRRQRQAGEAGNVAKSPPKSAPNPGGRAPRDGDAGKRHGHLLPP